MNITQKDTGIEISSGDASLMLQKTGVIIDDYVMDFPGEYERRGVFVEIRQSGSDLLYVITIEGKTLIYLADSSTVENLESLRDLNNKDMVIFPASEALWKTVETWEASVVVPYGEKTAEFLTKLGQVIEPAKSVTIKALDLESETTRFVALG